MDVEARALAQGDVLDYTPSAAKVGGQVVQIGDLAAVVQEAAGLAASEQGSVLVDYMMAVRNAAVSGKAGDDVFWDEDGTAVDGNTGCCTTDPGAADFWMGQLAEDLAATDTTAKVLLNNRGPFGSPLSWVEYFDDFFEYDTTATVGNWAVVEDAGATGGDVLTDAAGGVLSIGCDGDDNDECYVSSIAEIFKFQTDKKVTFETRIKLTEANTDDANFIIGLSDTVGANSLLDDGAGPMASYDGAVFFKVDGGTAIQFESSNAATQVTNATLATWASATWFTLKFVYDPGDGTTGTITPYVNGVVGTAHSITIAGLAEMHILMGVKAGGANEEALLVDYVRVRMER